MIHGPLDPAPNAAEPHDTAQLYRHYASAVARWAARLGRSRIDAEDVVQEVFLIVHRRLAETRGLRNPAPWLFRITKNLVRHSWRAQRRRALAGSEGLAQLPDASPTAAERIDRRRLRARLGEALGGLCERDRHLLLLCDVRHVPTSRVAALTGANPQTLRVQRFRARMLVARRLRELGETVD